MKTIIIFTPPDSKNSEYSAHLIEHIKMSYFQDEEFYFFSKNIRSYAYTFYTTYSFDDDVIDVNEFIAHLKNPFSKELYKFESKRIREELKEKVFYKKAIDSAGGILYNPNFRYGDSIKLSFGKIQDYHKDFYIDKDFYIVDGSSLMMQACESLNRGSNQVSVFPCKVGYEHEILFSTLKSPENLLAFHFIESLWDSAIEFYSGFYYFDDTIYGEFPDTVWVMASNDSLKYIQMISESFLEEFIKNSFNSINGLQQEIDASCFMQFGYVLSNDAKKNILSEIGKYHYNLLNGLKIMKYLK